MSLMKPVAVPMERPLMGAGQQPALNPMLMLQGLQGFQTAGNPGLHPLVAQALSGVQANPSTVLQAQRRG